MLNKMAYNTRVSGMERLSGSPKVPGGTNRFTVRPQPTDERLQRLSDIGKIRLRTVSTISPLEIAGSGLRIDGPITDSNITYSDYLKAAQESSAKVKKYEEDRMRTIGKPWTRYHSSVLFEYGTARPLEVDFNHFFSNGSFRSYLRTESAKRGGLLTLDVMGQGGYADVVKVKGDVGITAVDFRDKDQIETDIKKGKSIIAGDVLQNGVWEQARTFVDQKDPRRVKGFDVISCRPDNGWKFVFPPFESDQTQPLRSGSPPMRLLTSFTNRMIDLLSPEEGMLAMVLPPFKIDPITLHSQLEGDRTDLSIRVERDCLQVVRSSEE